MYRVIFPFADVQDHYHVYSEGDTFPRKGHEVSKERLKELSTKANAMERPLIEKVSEKEK